MATSSIDLGLRGLRDIEIIGSGGSAVVYRAVREVPGRFAMEETVAVKVLRSSWDTAARRRFDREQRVMNRLSDTAGFVPILETGETPDGSPYIIMPFYEGGSLQQRITNGGPVEWPRVVRLAEEVASTLALAHELDVYHRDIKPANILLTEAGQPHVADFGISLIADDTAAKATSTAAFTPAYSPPESFIEGLLPVAGTDIYGLAATMWAMLAGHAPFKEPGEQPTPVTVFGRVAMQQVGDLRNRVPSPICAFIEQAMAKRPEDRPSSMADFVAQLQAAREDAYRGVEVPRVEVEPLVHSDWSTATSRSDESAVEDAASPGEAGVESVQRPEPVSATTFDRGVAWADAVPVANGASSAAVTSDVATVATVAAGQTAPTVDATAPNEGSRFGWLLTVLVAAIITMALLLVVWMVVRPDSGGEALGYAATIGLGLRAIRII